MLENTSIDFRKFFLLEFTKQIIKNTKTEAIFELQERLKYKEKEIKTKIKEREEKKEETQEIRDILRRPIEYELKKQFIIPIAKPRIPMILRIPEPHLPPHLQYLRPYATEMEIDLGKLNPLLKDPAVSEIECQGADTNIIVRGQMGQKETGIILSEDEINQTIDTIASTSKIPKEEGLFKAVIGRINFSAIISENGSMFVIRKMVNRFY